MRYKKVTGGKAGQTLASWLTDTVPFPPVSNSWWNTWMIYANRTIASQRMLFDYWWEWLQACGMQGSQKNPKKNCDQIILGLDPISRYLVRCWIACLFFFHWKVIALQCCWFPLYNAVRKPYVYIYRLPLELCSFRTTPAPPHPSRSSQSTKRSSLCYIAASS